MKKEETKIKNILEEFKFQAPEIAKLFSENSYLKSCKKSELRETLVTLESLCFEEFQNIILLHPSLLSIPAYIIGEDAQKFLWKYREMEMVRKKILEKRG